MYQRGSKETPGCLIAVATVVVLFLILAIGLFFKAVPYVIAAMLIG